MFPRLHLITNIETWAPRGVSPGALLKVETFLRNNSSITLTLATHGPLADVLEDLASAGSTLLPAHIIAEAGTAIFHSREGGIWTEDVEYRDWAEACWDRRALMRLVGAAPPAGFHEILRGFSTRHAVFEIDSGMNLVTAVAMMKEKLGWAGLTGEILQYGYLLEIVPKGVHTETAARFLLARMPSLGPLMVCGSPGLNRELFREVESPVLVGDSTTESQPLGIRQTRIHKNTVNDPKGVMEALMRLAVDLGESGRQKAGSASPAGGLSKGLPG